MPWRLLIFSGLSFGSPPLRHRQATTAVGSATEPAVVVRPSSDWEFSSGMQSCLGRLGRTNFDQDSLGHNNDHVSLQRHVLVSRGLPPRCF
jgi:hypothetical protein